MPMSITFKAGWPEPMREWPWFISHNAYGAFRRGKSRAARHGRAGKCPRREYVSAEQFRDARAFSGLSREAAASFLKVSLRTIGNWETGQARPSYAAFKLLRVYRHGDLIHPAWSACHINHRGALVTPEGHEIKPHELGWLSLLVRRAALLRDVMRERDSLRGQLAVAAAALTGRGEREARALGLVHYKTSDTRPRQAMGESVAAQWFPQEWQGTGMAVSMAFHNVGMAPFWPRQIDVDQVAGGAR